MQRTNCSSVWSKCIQKAFEPSGSLAIAVSRFNHTTDLFISGQPQNSQLFWEKHLHPTWTVLRVQRSNTTSRDQPRCPEAMFLHSGLRIDPKEQAHQDLQPPRQSSQNIRCTAKCRAEFGLDPANQSPLYLSPWDAMLRSYHGCLFRFIPPERRYVSFEPSPGLQHFQRLRIVPFSDEFAIAYPCYIRCKVNIFCINPCQCTPPTFHWFETPFPWTNMSCMEAFSRLPGRLESGPVKCETRGEAAKPGLGERCLLQHPNILLLPHLVSCATEERGRDGGFDLEHKSRALSQDVTSHAATSTPCNLLEKQKLPIKKGKQKNPRPTQITTSLLGFGLRPKDMSTIRKGSLNRVNTQLLTVYGKHFYSLAFQQNTETTISSKSIPNIMFRTRPFVFVQSVQQKDSSQLWNLQAVQREFETTIIQYISDRNWPTRLTINDTHFWTKSLST